MKVYIADYTPEDQIKMQGICKENGWCCRPTCGFGRKRGDYPVQKVLNAFRMENNIRATARATGINPGPVHRILKGAGLLPKKS